MSINLIKLVALLCMVIDHIGEFIPQSPIWFRYIGRLSAPLFFYSSAWGFYYTSNRKKYLCRLYILGIIMSAGNSVLSLCLGNRIPISNNIFVTIFLGCIMIFLYETASSWKERIKYILWLIIQQLISFMLCVVFAELLNIPRSVDMNMLYYCYGSLFGSMIFTEGSVLFVLFFVIVYFLKGKKMQLSVFVCSFSGLLAFLVRRTYYMRGAISYLIPFNIYQWMMVFSVPLFFLYNGKKGKNIKWFYYLFYPLHIWVLYIIGNAVG